MPPQLPRRPGRQYLDRRSTEQRLAGQGVATVVAAFLYEPVQGRRRLEDRLDFINRDPTRILISRDQQNDRTGVVCCNRPDRHHQALCVPDARALDDGDALDSRVGHRVQDFHHVGPIAVPAGASTRALWQHNVFLGPFRKAQDLRRLQKGVEVSLSAQLPVRRRSCDVRLHLWWRSPSAQLRQHITGKPFQDLDLARDEMRQLTGDSRWHRENHRSDVLREVSPNRERLGCRDEFAFRS